MEVSQLSFDEGQERKIFEVDAAAVDALLCRLCGAQDSSRMFHLNDTYSIGMVVTASICHLLDSISTLLKVQEECEESMPKHICMACFNTAVDIQAFVDSAINFQKSTIHQLFPNSKLQEVSEVPTTEPAQPNPQEETSLFPYGVRQVTEETLEKESSSLITFDSDSYQCTSNSHRQENEITVKTDPYSIITEFIDTGHFQSTKGTPNKTVIEISPSSISTEDQPTPKNTDSSNIEISSNPNENQAEKASEDSTGSHELENSSVQRLEAQTGEVDETPINSEQAAREQESMLLQKGTRKCPTCGKTFPRQTQLKKHLKSHSEIRPFECQVCHMKFKYRRNLVEHSGIHDNPPSFICSVCGLTFKQRTSLLKHERTHQKANRLNFQCSVCGKRYSQSSHLNKHMRTIHGDNHGHACDQCNAVLQTRSSLRRHAATVHASSKKYVCPHCNKGFNNTQNYQGHIRSHTGERPYCCSTCNKTFTTSKALSRHRLIHEGIKSHRCSQCGKAFLELCDLKRHVKRHLLKRAKNASKDLASKYPESAASISVQQMVPGMNSLNLMVLPDSILFAESQQLLDNSGSTATEIILQDNKLNTTKASTSSPVLEANLMQNSEYSIQPATTSLQKESNILRTGGEVLGSPEFISSPQVAPPQEVDSVPVLDNTSVLHPSGVMETTPLHQASSPLQPNSINIQEDITTTISNHEAPETSDCQANTETATMVVLSSVGTASEYLPVADPDKVMENARCQQSERVLSHATWAHIEEKLRTINGDELVTYADKILRDGQKSYRVETMV